MERKIKVEREIKLTDENVDDIMVSALEGGIVYWCCEAEVVEDEYYGEYASEQISRGGSLRLYDAEEEDGPWILNLEKFVNGVKLWVEDGYADKVCAIDGDEIDCGQVDAIQADLIVQLALFGEIVYG